MTEQNLQENKSETTRKDLEVELISKAWIDESFRQQLINNPKEIVEQELGRKLPEGVNVEIIQEPSNTLYIVLPTKLETRDELNEEELDAVAGGIGIGALYGVTWFRGWFKSPN